MVDKKTSSCIDVDRANMDTYRAWLVKAQRDHASKVASRAEAFRLERAEEARAEQARCDHLAWMRFGYELDGRCILCRILVVEIGIVHGVLV